MEPDLNKEEIKELVQDPDQVQKLLEKKVYGTAHFSVQDAVEDIKEKYDDILTLEAVKSYFEIKSYFFRTFSKSLELSMIWHLSQKKMAN